jgi:hypothetical protein
MKNGQTHLPGGRIVYGAMLVVMSILLLFIASCQQAEKKQRAPLQATDTLEKDRLLKGSPVIGEVFPGSDSFQQGCQFIQGQAEGLLEEYHRGRPTKARKKQIRVELSKLEQEWKRMDCQQVFGYMIPPLLPQGQAPNK